MSNKLYFHFFSFNMSLNENKDKSTVIGVKANFSNIDTANKLPIVFNIKSIKINHITIFEIDFKNEILMYPTFIIVKNMNIDRIVNEIISKINKSLRFCILPPQTMLKGIMPIITNK